MDGARAVIVLEEHADDLAFLRDALAGDAGLRLETASEKSLPDDAACVLVPLGAIDAGLETIRRLRQRGYKQSIVCYAHAPEPRVVSPAMSVGAEDVLDLDTDSSALIRHTIARAILRRETALTIKSGLRDRQKWVQNRYSEAQEIANVGSWEADVPTWSAGWSPEMRRLVGLGLHEPVPGIEGYVERVHPDDRAGVQHAIIELFRSGVAFQLDHRIVHPSGAVLSVHARARAHLGPDGKVLRVYGTIQDLSEMRRLEGALSRSEATFRSIANNFPNGIVVLFDRDLRYTFMDGAWMAELGLAAERYIGRPLGEIVAAEQLQILEPAYRAALRGETQKFELRSPPRVYEVTTLPVVDKQGQVEAGLALYYDITALKNVEAALRRQTGFAMIHAGIAVAANEAKSLAEALPTCINLICTHGDWSLGHAYLPSAADPQTMMPTAIWNVGAIEQFEAFKQATAKAGGRTEVPKQPVWLETLGEDGLSIRAAAATADGLSSGFLYPVVLGADVAALLEFYSTTPRTRDDALLLTMDIVANELARLFGRERDRSRLVEDAEAMRSLSIVDELTGLHNRRGLLELGTKLLDAAQRDQRRVFLVYIDLDGMKLINDRLGHEAGDRALVETTGVLRRCFRGSDIISRLGGDEFVVLAIEGLNIDPAVFVERIQMQLAVVNSQPARAFQLQLSVGIEASDPTRAEPLDALLLRADQRMYVEKRARRSARA